MLDKLPTHCILLQVVIVSFFHISAFIFVLVLGKIH